MDNLMEETLKRIDELLTRQEDEKNKMLQEIRSDLAKLNVSSGKEDFQKPGNTSTEKEQGLYEENLQEEMTNCEDINAEIDATFESESEAEPEPMLVAVAGATSRAGTTHCAISIAHYLIRRNKKAAIMELNESGQFAALGRYFTQTPEKEFFYNDVKYYADCTLQLLDYVATGGEYDFLILDLGSYSAEKTLFLRSDVKFIVSGGKPWELENLLAVFRKINKNILLQSNFIFNFVPENGKEEIKNGMSELQQIYFSGYIENPFEEIDESIEKIIKEHVKSKEMSEETDKKDEKAKKVSIFRRNKREKKEKRRERKNNFVQAVSAAE